MISPASYLLPLPITIGALLEQAAMDQPERSALMGEEVTLTYAELASKVGCAVAGLREAGIGGGDRLAVLPPQGPWGAVALLAAMAGAVAAPLDPRCTGHTLREDLERLRVRGVLTVGAPPPPLHGVVHGSGFLLLDLFRLLGSGPHPAPGTLSSCREQPFGTCLVLQTSGTTAVPKVVPLTPANLLAAAAGTASVLHLTPMDCSLSAMPLFHIHGIVTSLLTPLLTGGSLLLMPSSAPRLILEALLVGRVTWMSAGPPLYQALLGEAQAEAQMRAAALPPIPGLRFLRSASAPLPPTLHLELERVFRVPVIEAYGMTETATLICSNRLPPARRVPGSVGPSAGPRVTVLNDDHRPLPPGACGEVAIAGENVTLGYEGDITGWVTGPTGERWFLSGDEGSFDAEGRLVLTGRRREMINRGGKKVIPRRVDEALIQHPCVREAVAFAITHPTLGEDVVAAVVPVEGPPPAEEDLRRHCFGVLAAHEVPSRILILDALPRGPTGKLQRIGLAEQLKEQFLPSTTAPATEMESLVCAIVAAVLPGTRPGRDDNFFFLGGDSLSAQQVISRLCQQLSLALPVSLLFEFPTPQGLSIELERRLDWTLAQLDDQEAERS